ncbi:MAG: cell wall hydrolase [Caulobacter sp.]
MRQARLIALAAVLLLGTVLAACATDYRLTAGAGVARSTAQVTRGYGTIAFLRLSADMDPAMVALARRHDGVPSRNYWGRVAGWETYSLARIPVLGVGALSEDEARLLNSLIGTPAEAPPPARPFVLKASEADRAAAIQCLTQAVYYEAATEPLEGQRAVAQTVLNRMRHPAYPKNVCGVVYQGSRRATGCQFSFTCDGSLARTPIPSIWTQSEAVARAALNGYVMPAVGTATHYHADYVAPYWAPTLFRITQIGRHIFYRWTGPWGLPPAFTGRYAGGENNLSAAILQGLDSRTQGSQLTADLGAATAGGSIFGEQKTVSITIDGIEKSYTVTVPSGPGDETIRAPGSLTPTRRPPTKDEVADINARLEAYEKNEEQKRAASDPDAPMSTAPRPAPPQPPAPPAPAPKPRDPAAPPPADGPVSRRQRRRQGQAKGRRLLRR